MCRVMQGDLAFTMLRFRWNLNSVYFWYTNAFFVVNYVIIGIYLTLGSFFPGEPEGDAQYWNVVIVRGLMDYSRL